MGSGGEQSGSGRCLNDISHSMNGPSSRDESVADFVATTIPRKSPNSYASQDNDPRGENDPVSSTLRTNRCFSDCAAANQIGLTRNGLACTFSDAATATGVEEEGGGASVTLTGPLEEEGNMADGGGGCSGEVRMGEVPQSEYQCMPTDMPKFLTAYVPKVS